jgi:hypothetical protein
MTNMLEYYLRFVGQVASRFDTHAFLYGSCRLGAAHEDSDIDVMIGVDNERHAVQVLNALSQLQVAMPDRDFRDGHFPSIALLGGINVALLPRAAANDAECRYDRAWERLSASPGLHEAWIQAHRRDKVAAYRSVSILTGDAARAGIFWPRKHDRSDDTFRTYAALDPNELRVDLLSALDRLKERSDERKMSIFKAVVLDGRTFEEAAEPWGISRERGRQIVQCMMRDLRRHLTTAAEE